KAELVCGDEVTRASDDPADGGLRWYARNSTAEVGERARAADVRADEIALRAIAGGEAVEENDRASTVARDDVARRRRRAADGFVPPAGSDSIAPVGNRLRSTDVRADQIALQQIALANLKSIAAAERHSYATVARNEVASSSWS